jgi:hypothetical protein
MGVRDQLDQDIVRVRPVRANPMHVITDRIDGQVMRV